ncbi:hypothetical protein GCM10007079_12710 [Nocardiopsis terrae]|uniref:SPW repeat-containing integral membrane domain-containing protein n=1 Tax=Nocardiopsis terrae TaxID=372655 RepID=A0ABR9HCA2_9ACTN|nr:SPW repeat protein [Nocardiopsis terrae]MBE1456521.1 hypothetical protein [Nocardiopsis terrae]GHC76411.1 hypothetical protein GCM10007079_12710 [Nocardiopsis terrae]
MRVKGRWADWASVVLGIAVGLSWIWHGMYGFSGGLFFVLGLAVVLAAAVSLTRPGAVSSEVGVLAVGALIFALPWILGFTGILGAALTAWIGGGAIAVLGAVGLVMAGAARRRDPELAWGSHSNTVPD